ncbi:TetR/AcrR family transcriptional regulator [Patulibacter defluvii]|uniref:TetR/AcrR family transcriptional regulator n=1 Tax=Patulibacter defluvii TaxID=3095358 RepID=UPI002A750107|nr:TetR/AcrR family transcriptional regulator [Patulibacter sp. DM4]
MARAATDPDDPATPGKPTSRSDRRRERTRGRLVVAGRELIAEKGVAGLRISEITEAADVALGSFYNHFKSKEELVEAIVSESLEALAAAVVDEAPADADPAILVSVANRRFVRLAYDDPEFARLLVNLSHADALFAAATHPFGRIALDRGVASGRFEISDVDVTLTVLVGGALTLMRSLLEGHHGPDADRPHAETVLRAIGVPTDEAREISRRPLAPMPSEG